MSTTALTAMLTLLTLLVAGCETSVRESLPTGATLLDSDEAACDGPITIAGNPDVTVDEGQTTTLAIDDDQDMDWDCQSDSSLDHGGEIDCPTARST